MELRHLRYFTAVAEALNFSKAAVRLHITQPALSRQVRDLENEIGFPLFERRGVRTELTPAGQMFLLGARRLLMAADQLVEKTRAVAKPQVASLRFGHFGHIWVERFAPAFRRFSRLYPKTVIKPIELMPVELAAELRRGALDVAFLGQVDDALRREFNTRKIGSVSALIVLPASHPLAKYRKLSLVQLEHERWVAWSDRDFPGRKQVLLDACRAAGFKPSIAHEVDSLGSVFMCVATGNCVSDIVPMARKMPHAGVVFAEIKPPGIVLDIHLAWRKSSSPRPEVEALMSCLAEQPS